MTQTFGAYQLIKKLATGGMAEVWLARQTGIQGFNRHVVIKRILPHLAEDPQFVEMFLNEARLAAQLTHPNLGQIYDLGEQGGQYYIAMEYIRGEDLGRITKRAWDLGRWLARPVALRIVADACQGLHYAHTRLDEAGRPLGLVHRDVSPQNILVSFDGAVKVVDFGIAKAAGSTATRSGAIKGKFAYMSPEHAGARRSTPAAGASTRAPTSSRWAWCCTSCSPGCGRSSATASSPRCRRRWRGASTRRRRWPRSPPTWTRW